jgi:hypothetical protein
MSIHKVGPNHYKVKVSKGRGADGNYPQAVRNVHGSYKDAHRVEAALKTDLDRGEYQDPSRESLATYLASWLDAIRPPHGDVKVSTWRSYESHVRVHIAPDTIAERRVAAITPEEVGAFFRRLLDKGLSPAAVGGVRRTLRAALNAHPTLQPTP